MATADDGSASRSDASGSEGSSDSTKSKKSDDSDADSKKPTRTSRADSATDSDTSTDDRDKRDTDPESEIDPGETDPGETDPDETDPADETGQDGETESDPESGDTPDETPENTPDVASGTGGKHRAPEVEPETKAQTQTEDVVDTETEDVAEAEAEPEAEVPVAGEDIVADPVDEQEPEAPVDDAEVPSGFVSSIEADISSGDGAVVMRAAAQSAPGLDSTPSELLTLLNSVGSLVYNFYTSAMQFLAGPARAPFGSSVRVERSTLTIGDGVEVAADWYFPDNDEPPTGLIYFQHGFLATASFYNATAAYLAEKTNSIVVAPTLTWNIFDTANYPLMLPETHRAIADLFAGDRAALNTSAQAAGFGGTLPTRLVLAGHSAGGGLVTGTAGYMAELGIADDLAGVVMLDGAGHLDYMSSDLAKIPHSIPVYNLAAEPYSWNTFGDANLRLAQARPGMFTGVVVDGGSHSDSMQSSNPVIQFAAYLATGFSSPLNVWANEVLASGWINDMFHGTHTTGLYGTSGSTVSIAIGWWTASAQVVPAEHVDLSFVDTVYACLLNPTTQNCTYVPFWKPADSTATRRPGTFAA
ncbi:alpha/beta hydrolase [Mycolicibacterium hippocampi]|uniref:alpha/beta hydrolase n=1 Tax=Mycolicibacterium hippocampi TaxID=659824 RepID=UPI0013D7EC1F|nr:alpha/beta hydrolase [Mycolicibacterium hippocampi]